MHHETVLIATIAAGLALAFLFGLLATRFRLPPILGYLIAGVMIGPFTPGYVADQGVANQLAELGVILLMFGVGLHFSIGDLLSVRRIAIPGALGQIAVATILGAGLARLWDWSWTTGIVFGLALSVASTVVLLRALEDRGILDSADGRIAVGWLIVEDLVTVLALVFLPALASDGNLGATLGVTLLKVGSFVALMLIVGRRAVPWLLGRVVTTGSRELFTLAVLAVALGIAVGAATWFGVSFALGAFFAGVIVNESDFSHEAARNALPLQDAFAVLFFVSVGMLFDPTILIREPLQVLAVVLIIMIGKSLASFFIVLVFRYPVRTALVISASLAQIGEFSFIVAALAVSLQLVPPETHGLIVAGALISITLNPFVFNAVEPLGRWIRKRSRFADLLERPSGELSTLPAAIDHEKLTNHVVLIGHGRVGAPVAAELSNHAIPYVILEQSRERAESLRERGLPVIYGDATRPSVLAHAHLERASLVVVAAPDAFQARAILALAHRLNPDVEIIVRTHSASERAFLERNGARQAIVGERELAITLTRNALRHYGVEHDMEQIAARITDEE